MSRTAKIIIGIVVALVLLGAAAVFAFVRFSGAITTNEAEVSEIGQRIVDHRLPPGFTPEFGTDIFGLRWMFAVHGSESMIMLFEAPGEDEENVRLQAQGELSNQRGGNVSFEYIGSRPVVINGSDTELETYRATEDGQELLQEIAIFPAKSGNVAVVMIMGPSSEFDDLGTDAFVESMR